VVRGNPLIFQQEKNFVYGPFSFSKEFFQFVTFFQQYQLSHTFFSPDSMSFVFPHDGGIYVQRLVPGAQEVRISDSGVMAFWSPR